MNIRRVFHGIASQLSKGMLLLLPARPSTPSPLCYCRPDPPPLYCQEVRKQNCDSGGNGICQKFLIASQRYFSELQQRIGRDCNCTPTFSLIDKYTLDIGGVIQRDFFALTANAQKSCLVIADSSPFSSECKIYAYRY